MREFGWYAIQAPSSGYPPGYTTDSFFALFVSGRDIAWSPWLLMDLRTGATFRGGYSVGQFMPWEPLVTATLPEEHDLPLAEGYVGGAGGAWYFKEQNNKVTLTVSDIQKSDGAGLVSGIIGTLPADYRPSKLISVACSMWTGNQAPGLLQALPNGDVWITVEAAGCRSVHGQLTFVAA